MLGPSARALLRAFGPRPQTPRPSASDLRPSKLFCLASSDGWKSRAFGPRKSVAFQRWMDARAFGPRTAGLRPAVWGPSAPKPLTHKISTFCNFVQNGQKIPRPSASVCSGLGPRSAGLRPAVWGPSAPKPPTHKISTFCIFVQNGQKIPRPSASVCSGLGPRSAGLRPAVWGPSAPKPPTSKISTFCNFVQNGQKILQKIFLYSAR